MKKIFNRLDSSSLIKQITIVGLLTAFGIALEKPLHFHVGTFHLCFASVISCFLMVSLTNWKLSLIGTFTMVTIGELLISGHYDFWVNYLPMLIVLITVEFIKMFKNFWITLLFLVFALFQFELCKVLIYFLAYGESKAYMYFFNSLVQIGIGTPILLFLYSMLFRILKLINYNVYSYSSTSY